MYCIWINHKRICLLFDCLAGLHISYCRHSQSMTCCPSVLYVCAGDKVGLFFTIPQLRPSSGSPPDVRQGCNIDQNALQWLAQNTCNREANYKGVDSDSISSPLSLLDDPAAPSWKKIFRARWSRSDAAVPLGSGQKQALANWAPGGLKLEGGEMGGHRTPVP